MAVVHQTPVNSPFDRHSTGADVLAGIDRTGTTAIVTGGYSGIGLETTKALVGKGAKVIVPVRDPQKATETLADIPGVQVEVMDLADLASVRAFAEKMNSELDKVDLLINNAGIMATPLRIVGNGWESQFAVNHLGHFALTTALMPLIQKAPHARVIALTSGAHKRSPVHFEDIHFQNRAYDKWLAYGQSKTANALFANALSRRLQPTGGLAFSVHPGGILTPLQRHLPTEEMVALGWISPDGTLTEQASKGFKTTEQGCSTTLWAATSPLLEGLPGVYCEDCNVAHAVSPDRRAGGVESYACDDDAAEQLWSLSEEAVASSMM